MIRAGPQPVPPPGLLADIAAALARGFLRGSDAQRVLTNYQYVMRVIFGYTTEFSIIGPEGNPPADRMIPANEGRLATLSGLSYQATATVRNSPFIGAAKKPRRCALVDKTASTRKLTRRVGPPCASPLGSAVDRTRGRMAG